MEERAVYPNGGDILLELVLTIDCDGKWLWPAMSIAEDPSLPLDCDFRRMRHIAMAMAPSSTTTPPTTPPTIAPIGVDVDLDGVDEEEGEGEPTSECPWADMFCAAAGSNSPFVHVVGLVVAQNGIMASWSVRLLGKYVLDRNPAQLTM